MFRTILTPLTYSNAGERFCTDLTCHMRERAWSLQENNSLRRCWIIHLNIIIVTAHHSPVKIFKKLLEESWNRKKKIPNVTSIKLLRIFFSVPLHYQCTKEVCKRDIWETTCFRHSCRNDEIIQGMYDSINNQQFFTLQFWGTGWRHKKFRGTGWHRKRFKNQSKQRSKCSNLHYQQKFSTRIIEEPVRPKDRPRQNPSDLPFGHIGCAGNPRDFGRAPDGAPEVDHHRRDAQWRTHFPDSEVGKPDGQGRIHAAGRQHLRSDRQVDSPKPKLHKYLWLLNADRDTIYCQPKSVHSSAGS